MVEETSVAAVSISSNKSSENEVIADMTFKEAGRQWRQTTLLLKKA